VPFLGRGCRVQRQAGRGSGGTALPVASGGAAATHDDDAGHDDHEDCDAADGDAERHCAERLRALLQRCLLHVHLKPFTSQSQRINQSINQALFFRAPKADQRAGQLTQLRDKRKPVRRELSPATGRSDVFFCDYVQRTNTDARMLSNSTHLLKVGGVNSELDMRPFFPDPIQSTKYVVLNRTRKMLTFSRGNTGIVKSS